MMQILVVRHKDEFSRTLAASGYSVINCPVIRTETAGDLSELEDAVSRLDKFDGVFITSATAAEIFARSAGKKLASYPGRVFVLGRRSFDILKETSADVLFDESVNTADEMLGVIGEGALHAKRFLFVRGQRSMRTIPDHLKGIADVEELIVYRTVTVDIDDEQKKKIREKASLGEISVTCFFSPSGIESFVEQFGTDLLRNTGLAAIGETTAAALHALDLKTDVVASMADSNHFAEDVLKYLKGAAQGV